MAMVFSICHTGSIASRRKNKPIALSSSRKRSRSLAPVAAARRRSQAYATAGEKIRGTTIRADGAAFRSRKNWYALKFNCELAPDGESVIGFEFLVGDPVPQERWDELGLPAVH